MNDSLGVVSIAVAVAIGVAVEAVVDNLASATLAVQVVVKTIAQLKHNAFKTRLLLTSPQFTCSRHMQQCQFCLALLQFPPL